MECELVLFRKMGLMNRSGTSPNISSFGKHEQLVRKPLALVYIIPFLVGKRLAVLDLDHGLEDSGASF